MARDLKTVLVIEDDVDLCNSLQGALQVAGFRAVGATTFRDGLLKIRNQGFSCILLDIRLGEESGEDILQHARGRAESLNKETPIVVISGNLDRDLVAKLVGKIQGALVKPFGTAAVVETVRKLTG